MLTIEATPVKSYRSRAFALRAGITVRAIRTVGVARRALEAGQPAMTADARPRAGPFVAPPDALVRER